MACEIGSRDSSELSSTGGVLQATTAHLWGDNVAGHHHDLLGFSSCFWSLRHVHVHFVPIKVRIVWRGDGQVQAEGRVRQDAHSMALCSKQALVLLGFSITPIWKARLVLSLLI